MGNPILTNADLKPNRPPMSPEDYQMQRQLNERADYERYASQNTPTYGAETSDGFSSDPNRIAERNAIVEMKRTGLDRYYHPNSAAYYAAFQGIKDKYLQQEMSKKASIENEGKQLYSNKMGAFDKLIQDQYGLQKEKIESAGLEGMRKAQQKLYEIQAEGDGMTPAQRLADKRAQINSIQAQADDARAIIVAQLKEETDPQMRNMLNDGLGKIPGHVRAATEAIRRGNDYTGLQEFNTWLANPRGYRAAAPAKVPVAQGVNGDFINEATGDIYQKRKKTNVPQQVTQSTITEKEQQTSIPKPANDMDYLLSESPTEQQIKNQQALQNVISAPKRVIIDRPLEAHKMKKEAFEKDLAAWKARGLSKEEIKKLAKSKHREYLSSLQ